MKLVNLTKRYGGTQLCHIWLVLTVLILSTCTNIYRTDDRAVTLQEMDQQSCLSLVKPDISSENELSSALYGCPTINASDISSFPIANTNVTGYVWKLPENDSGLAQAIKGKVISIAYSVRYGLRLKQLIEKHRPPEYVWRTGRFNPDKCIASILLMYPQQGLDFGIDKEFPCGEDIAVDPELTITDYDAQATWIISTALMAPSAATGAATPRLTPSRPTTWSTWTTIPSTGRHPRSAQPSRHV